MTTEAGVYPVLVALRGMSAVPLAVLAVDREQHVLLGRDLLNRHRLVLDGPNLKLEVHEPSAKA